MLFRSIRQSEQVVMLMDSSKVGVKCSFMVCGLKEVDVLISDGKLPDALLEECRRQGVTVL